MHKLTVDPSYCIARLSSTKIKIWDLLCFQGVLVYDWELRKPSFQWRSAILVCCGSRNHAPACNEICTLVAVINLANGTAHSGCHLPCYLQDYIKVEPQPWKAWPEGEGVLHHIHCHGCVIHGHAAVHTACPCLLWPCSGRLAASWSSTHTGELTLLCRRWRGKCTKQ